MKWPCKVLVFTWTQALVRTPHRRKHRYNSDWKILLRMTSYISLRIQKSYIKSFSNSLQLWVCALPYEPGENIRVDYVVQITLHRLAELKLIADGFQIHLNLASKKYVLELWKHSLKMVLTTLINCRITWCSLYDWLLRNEQNLYWNDHGVII